VCRQRDKATTNPKTNRNGGRISLARRKKGFLSSSFPHGVTEKIDVS